MPERIESRTNKSVDLDLGGGSRLSENPDSDAGTVSSEALAEGGNAFQANLQKIEALIDAEGRQMEAGTEIQGTSTAETAEIDAGGSYEVSDAELTE